MRQTRKEGVDPTSIKRKEYRHEWYHHQIRKLINNNNDLWIWADNLAQISCSNLNISENDIFKKNSIYPNPVKNNQLFVTGKNYFDSYKEIKIPKNVKMVANLDDMLNVLKKTEEIKVFSCSYIRNEIY